MRGSVQAVDHTARTVTIQGEDGKAVTLDVPATATRFDQVKVGDTVIMTYYDGVSVRPKPADEPAVNRTMDPTTTPTAGALPGATRARQRVATMTLTALDPATRSVTFSGPTGNAYTRYVVDTVDPTVFASLKTGDRVDVTWTEALSLQLAASTPAPAAAAPAPLPNTDDFRHRFTLSLQVGVDNSFSGKMIKASSGTTTGGQPINLNETSFDDVYGRLGTLKIGAGYRTSPRTETVFNWIWSESDAHETAARVGSVGAAGEVPLDVNFTSYRTGESKAATGCTSRGPASPPTSVISSASIGTRTSGGRSPVCLTLSVPGLAAQDGKFFEKSWALSLGPTGGMLIGLGPLELMVSPVAFSRRASDVDWLVEEGLKDINDDSSRWSLPFVLGARVRF